MAEPAGSTGVRRWWHSRFGAPFAREVLIVLGLLIVYKYGRSLVSGESSRAVHHAREVIGMERDLRIFTEERLQQVVIGTGETVEWVLNSYYLFAHVVVTAVAFFWLFWRHPDTYVRFRRVMVAMTLAGLAIHLLYPLAPPRMFPHLGFVDTGRRVGPASYGHGSAVLGFRQPVRGHAVVALRMGARGGVGRHPGGAQPRPVPDRRASDPDPGHDRAHRQPLLARRDRRDPVVRRGSAVRSLADQPCSVNFARISVGIGVES